MMDCNRSERAIRMPIGRPMRMAINVQTVTMASVTIVSFHRPKTPIKSMETAVPNDDLDVAACEIDDRQHHQENDEPRRIGKQPFQIVQEPLERLYDGIDHGSVGAHQSAKAVVDLLAGFSDNGVADRRKIAKRVRQETTLQSHRIPLFYPV